MSKKSYRQFLFMKDTSAVAKINCGSGILKSRRDDNEEIETSKGICCTLGEDPCWVI